MNATLRQIYDHLPPMARSVAASIHGARLSRWRYGADTDRLVAEFEAREYWSPAQWDEWTARRLGAVLTHARAAVPYYRKVWDGREGPADRLSAWPLLDKTPLRDDARAFVADDADIKRMWHEHTSGTTGTSLDLWWSPQTVRHWYALYERRIRHWHGVTRADRWAMLGGQLVVDQRRTRPPYWVWNGPMRQLYLSSYHLTAKTAAAYLDAMRQYRVRYAVGYSSSLFALAALADEHNLTAPALVVAITNAEPLFDHQRAMISRVFGCPVRETYGMSEIVSCATECERGTLHLWPDAGVTEVLADTDATPAPPGTAGRLVATGLINIDMPLIRYIVGDRATLAPAPEQCACGRTLPIVRQIDGRSDDVIVTPDGRHVGRLDPVFKSDMRIREAQIIQESRDVIHVRLVPAEGFNAGNQAELRRRLVERLGEMRYEFEVVDHIPRTASGKFRAVISRVGRPV